MFKRNWITKVVSVFLVLIVLIGIQPITAEAAKPIKPPSTTEPRVVNYVALGDSIATGTVTYWSNITSYVTYFYQYLKSYYGKKTTVNLQNLAQDGNRSNELLLKLQTNDTVKAAVSNADIITISIGGNNLMQAAEIPGFTTIDWAAADEGVKDFQDQWVQIISLIKELNGGKNAKIIVSTVYNPFNMNPPLGYEDDQGLHNLTDGLPNPRLLAINETITQNASLGYKVAHVHDAFHIYADHSMGQITYFYPSIFSYLFRNPHPNSEGQSIITDLHKKAFLNY